MTIPKLFISYSWSNPDHEARVLQLATELRENGVDVILDKWDLREGQNAIHFMESMVNDSDVQKVLLVCDRSYVEKTNRRAGGVGTEAQIISPEVYARQKQNKFVALVLERDDQGAPIVPHYYKSRIHIDFSEPSRLADAFEQLLRWAHDRPLFEKPQLGAKPAFLDDSDTPTLGVTSRYRQALHAVQEGKSNAGSILLEYLSTLASELEKLRMGNVSGEFDDAVIASIETFLPFRNQLIQVLDALALHRPGYETTKQLQRFLESLLPYSDRSPNSNSWRESDFDNYRFIIHEIFLYTVATLLRYERFDEVNQLLSSEYYWPNRQDGRYGDIVSHCEFRQHLPSLEARNKRLKLNRASLQADLLKQRCVELPLTFTHLTQADFVIFLRSAIASTESWGGWWPVTLVYCGRFASRFELFARARSADYLRRLLPMLGVSSAELLKQAVGELRRNRDRLPHWSYETLDPGLLMSVDELATRP